MPLYVRDYLADTAHLSITESGVYLHLIMHYWLHGALPADDAELARIVRVDKRRWMKKIRPRMVVFFDPGWKHKRIDFELTKSSRLSVYGRIAGLSSAAARKNRSTAVDQPLNDRSNGPATDAQPSQSEKKEKKERDAIASPKKESSTPPERPPDEAVAFAAALAWPTDRIATEWSRFCDWHIAHGKTRKHDVAMMAAWRNWCRSPYQQAKTGGATSSTMDRLAQWEARSRAQLAERDRLDPAKPADEKER